MRSFRFERDLRLPRSMRKDLGKGYGRLIGEGEIKQRIGKARKVYAVGDVVVSTLLRLGYTPAVSIFDCKVGRKEVVYQEIKHAYPHPIRIRNRGGTISKALWNAVENAGGLGKPVGIRVYGEEDLAAVACAYLAPKGSVLLYGVPGRGIDKVVVTVEVKAIAARILQQMKDYASSSSRNRNSLSVHVRKS